MEASEEKISLSENEKKALQGLLDAFEDAFSLKEIASAYWQAGRNAELASEILFNSQGSTCSSATNSFIHEERGEECSSYGNSSDSSSYASGHKKVPKQKKCSASMGTGSGFLGKDYIRSTPLSNESSVSTKPLFVNLVPVPKTIEDQANSSSPKDDGAYKDMEDFLFSMLGDGFQLDREAIQAVLGHCGYDMRKSMDELLNLSVLRLEGKDEGRSMRKLARDSERLQQEALDHNTNSSNGDIIPSRNKKELPRKQKQKRDIEKEILASLFDSVGPEKKQEVPRKAQSIKPKRSLALGALVVEPPRDSDAEQKTPTVYLQQKVNSNAEADGHDEDDYEVLQSAMKEYQATMKEYYKAAVDAYADGDHVRAGKLLDQGHFFHKKARGAWEESARKIFKVRNGETEIGDTLTLDLHDYGAKEAIRLLKFHLSSVSIFKYLKVIIDAKDEDATKGARKRRIMKMLEGESFKWVEGQDTGTILICMVGTEPSD